MKREVEGNWLRVERGTREWGLVLPEWLDGWAEALGFGNGKAAALPYREEEGKDRKSVV